MLSELIETCTEVLRQGKITARNARNAGTSSGASAGTSRRGSPQLNTTLHSAAEDEDCSFIGTPSLLPEVPMSTEVTAKEAHDLLFIFLVEVVYSTLVQQLRSLVQYVATDRDSMCSQARDNYKAYLTARQLVGNVSGTGLARFSWASTLYPDDEENADVGAEGGGPTRSSQEGYPNRGGVAHSGEKADGTSAQDKESGDNKAHSSIGSYLLSQIWQPSPVPTPARPVSTHSRYMSVILHCILFFSQLFGTMIYVLR